MLPRIEFTLGTFEKRRAGEKSPDTSMMDQMLTAIWATYAGSANRSTGEIAQLLREHVAPLLVPGSPLVDVEYCPVTAGGRSRHASFKGAQEGTSQRRRSRRTQVVFCKVRELVPLLGNHKEESPCSS